MLSKFELKFIRDLRKGNLYDYDNDYIRSMKHRILAKYRMLSREVLLIDEVLDRLKTL